MKDFLWALVAIGNSVGIGLLAYCFLKLDRDVKAMKSKIPVKRYTDGS